MKKTSLIVFCFIVFTAQAQFTSIHNEQSKQFKQIGTLSEKQWDVIQGIRKITISENKSNCNLTHSVYGWNPYWMGTAYNNYDFDLLSTFSYFSYELVPSTGNYSTIHSWKTTNSINLAQAAGAKVELCVTNFGSANNNAFLTNMIARQALIDSLITLINLRNADGVNIDFEGISGANRNDLTSFMIDLSSQLKTAISGATVTIATYSVDWNNVFDLPALDSVVDQFIIMGYGYHYGGSSNAGPTDPLYSGSIWSSLNLIRSIDYYLNNGVTPSKLLIGLPYYGREWETATNTVPSATTGGYTSARTYRFVQDNLSGNYSNRQYDYHSETPYYVFNNGSNWRQTFCNDPESLGARYDIVKQMKIGGIGIWALGYDNGYTDLWNLIEDKFTDCSVVACSDTLYDKGGPFGQYSNNEAYNFTISPTGATRVSLTFLEFDVEVGYDSLWVYDGNSILAPLIGAFSGIILPPNIISSSGSLTLKFYSDGATIGNGWKLIYSCEQDTIKPTTLISGSPLPSVSSNFNTIFTDADNNGGSGVMHQFYQVEDYDGLEWRANSNNGFFNDNFDVTIHSDWIDSSGVWSIVGGSLKQNDESNSNTNLFTSCNQNLNPKYLYQFKAKISGSGINKRAGFHYMSDDASQSNRGNSYFVWFRQDNNKLQFYKVSNNVFSLVKEISYSFNANQFYDYKITYDKNTGTTDVYVDDVYAASWVDVTPITLGNYISFRSAGCVYDVDEIQVYQSRTISEAISVGVNATNDIRYDNLSVPSGIINSIVIDTAHNVSTIATEMVNVNFSNVGVNELRSSKFLVYPNPAKESINIKFNKQQTGRLIIRDLIGCIVSFEKLNQTKQVVINVDKLISGIYFISYNNNVVKFVKE